MQFSDRIIIEPGKRSGQPPIRGTRMTVHDVLAYLAAGMTTAELLADFPDLSEGDARLSRLCRRPGAIHAHCKRVKLLLDQNLSPRLVERLADVYPGSAHVSSVVSRTR